MGGDGRVSHLARCKTAAAEAESPPPAGRGSDAIHGDRQAGARDSRRRADGSAGAPIPGTSSEARSEVTEATRDRKARGQRRSNACGAGSPVGGGADANACWSGPARRLPWQARPVSEGGEERHEHDILGGQLVAPRVPVRRGRLQVTRYFTRGPKWCGTPRPTARPADRLVASRAGGDGESPDTLLHVRSPQPPTRVLLPSPAQDPWREIRESLPRG
jgi:hypothetical protein